MPRKQLHVLGTIVTSAAATLHRTDLRESAFPEAQDMLRDLKLVSHFTDRAKCFRRLVHGCSPLALDRK